MMFQLGGIFDAAFFTFYFFLLCDMGFYYSLFYFTTRRGWESDSQRRIRRRRQTTKTNNTPDPERPLRETRRDSELDRRSLNDYTNAREGRGRWEGGSKSRLWAEQRPRAPYSLRVLFFKLSLTF